MHLPVFHDIIPLRHRRKELCDTEQKMLPKDINMLVSYINTGLRDKYEDLEDMASSEGFDVKEITERLAVAGFVYSDELRRFIGE